MAEGGKRGCRKCWALRMPHECRCYKTYAAHGCRYDTVSTSMSGKEEEAFGMCSAQSVYLFRCVERREVKTLMRDLCCRLYPHPGNTEPWRLGGPHLRPSGLPRFAYSNSTKSVMPMVKYTSMPSTRCHISTMSGGAESRAPTRHDSRHGRHTPHVPLGKRPPRCIIIMLLFDGMGSRGLLRRLRQSCSTST